ncbi:succinyl-CoA synthetase-like protein [Hypoxylon fragiforme]|uniref:succinyl-CoA synthetase-like protein n=1 Tax=Hypoxylon fragiforme TaxID=63214 RepID=UPI0020C698A2|nr:succinyl-CoA synthetase-like protein [Hypoxylon fragiforme]KAI2609791.1 succinyl-CoA synthetase-like protein [Hypoxylon fragiforme]
MEVLRPDATGIYVAAHQAVGAIEEAIEAEVPLIVAVAEHIPLHDFFRIYSMLQTQSTCRLLGANSPGIISAVGKCRIGFHPIPCFQPGRIGIVARSGTLSYETAASTLRAGLGQSMCIGIGGDMIPGTTLKEGLQILVEDDDTEGIAFIGEVGGYGELEAAEFIKSYRAQNKNPKPIAALVAGMQTVPGQPMGHAGAVSLLGEPSTATKLEALRAAGVAIVGHPSRFGPVLKSMIDATNVAASGSGISQRRGIHTVAHRPTSSQRALPRKTWCQRRSFYLSETALRLLRKRGLPIADSTTRQSSLPLEEEEETFLDLPQPQGPDIVDTSRPRRLVVTFNRSAKNPCIIAFHPDNNSEFEKFDFDYGAAAEDIPIEDIAFFQGLPLSSIPSLGKIVTGLVRLFKEKEAFQLSVEIRCKDSKDGLTMVITDAQLGFDDAAFRSGGRHADLQKLRTKLLEHTVESDGITYMKLAPPGNIGTLVNGAGLAMNTVDALAAAGGHAANFLDTGGKATSETVKRSFELILEDQDVKV